jgi:hypothetical protein
MEAWRAPASCVTRRFALQMPSSWLSELPGMGMLSSWTASRYLLRHDGCLWYRVSRMKRTVARTPHLRRAGLVVVIASLAAIALATLLPQSGIAAESHLCLVCGSLGGVSAILNVLLFLPLGIGLAIYGFSAKRAVVLMCVLGMLIEIAQLLFIPGRNATIGDVLANSLGGALGFAISGNAFILLRPSPRIATLLTIGWSTLWLAIQTGSAFGFKTTFPQSRYYGQIARSLGDFDPFSGTVLYASIGDVVVPDMQFDDSRRLRQLLIAGASVTTTMLPSQSGDENGPIVRVADADEREILVLAQKGADLVFGERTEAVTLGLRPPRFVLSNVFLKVRPERTRVAMDSLTVGARYSSREVLIRAESKVGHSRRIPITAALGWTMLLPFQWFIAGSRSELVIGAVWTACLLLPIGYWLGWSMRSPRADATIRWMTAGLTASLLFYVGMILVPRGFGVGPASATDWLAALMGFLGGVVVAARAFAEDASLIGEGIAL